MWLSAPQIPLNAVVSVFPGVNFLGLQTYKTMFAPADGRVLTGVSGIKVTQ
jgi:hypothetical protein